MEETVRDIQPNEGSIRASSPQETRMTRNCERRRINRYARLHCVSLQYVAHPQPSQLRQAFLQDAVAIPQRCLEPPRLRPSPERIHQCAGNRSRAPNCGGDSRRRRRRERYGFLQEVPLSPNGECNRSQHAVYDDRVTQRTYRSRYPRDVLRFRALEKDNAKSARFRSSRGSRKAQNLQGIPNSTVRLAIRSKTTI